MHFCFFVFFSSNPQSDAYIAMLQWIGTVIVISQLYCNGHILYCKWKQSKQEAIIVPSIRIHDHLQQQQHQNHPRQLNTSSKLTDAHTRNN